MIGVADHCFEDGRIKDYSVNKVAMAVCEEVKKMCSRSVESVLQNSLG